jgi:DNA invertase Pin-like site-specific DNA recombinase
MSEAELHVLRARLQGGILNKARRGELQCPLPVGFVFNANNEPVPDPDKQVRETIRFFFETFGAPRRPAVSSRPSVRRGFCSHDG